MISSIVVDMRTGLKRDYDLPPEQALVCAWYQSRNDYNTWTYDASLVPIRRAKFFLFADDLAVRLPKGPVMELTLPHTKLTVRRSYQLNGQSVENEILEGEVEMSQQQQDEYKQIIGDAQARISVGRDMGELDYGSGGKVFVSVSLACDQSQASITRAVQLAAYLADGFVAQHHHEMKQRCIQMGILKPLSSP